MCIMCSYLNLLDSIIYIFRFYLGLYVLKRANLYSKNFFSPVLIFHLDLFYFFLFDDIFFSKIMSKPLKAWWSRDFFLFIHCFIYKVMSSIHLITSVLFNSFQSLYIYIDRSFTHND
jgi:uncharacterized membrane protein YczE